MYTFCEVVSASRRMVDISIPNKSIVRIVATPTQEIDFLEMIAAQKMPFSGTIYCDGVNIHSTKKSYQKRGSIYISPLGILDANLTVKNNLKLLSSIYGLSSLWEYPIRYFQFDASILQKYPMELSDVEIAALNMSELFWFMGNTWIIPFILEMDQRLDLIKRLILAKVNDGNGTLFYRANEILGFDEEIVLEA